jgi:hypothetical protein
MIMHTNLIEKPRWKILLLVPRNFSRGRGVIPSLAGLGEQSAQLTAAWVLPACNVASWSVVQLSVSTPGLRRQCFPLGE